MLYVIGAFLILVIVFVVKKQTAPKQIFSTFGINDTQYKLLSTDLGDSEGRVRLLREGVIGIPDAVFEAVAAKSLLVGEFKSRKYRDQVKLHEFYQLMLYMGHLQVRYPHHEVSGCIAYADNQVQIHFDPVLYRALLGLREEYWQTLKNRKPVNDVPLHKRMKVNAANQSLRLTAKM